LSVTLKFKGKSDMPIQDYNIYTGKGYAGDLFDSAPRVTSSATVEAATLGFGLALKPGSLDKGVVAGHTAGNVFAISMREYNHEASTRPSDGTTTYKQAETASIMREGFILVKVTARAAVANTLLNVNDTTGEFAGGAAGAGETAAVNVTALEAGQVGDVIKARIDIIHA
jgi:hypothetical protein